MEGEDKMLSAAVGSKVIAAVSGEIAKGATPLLVKNFIEKVVTPYFSGKKAKAKIVNGTRRYARNIEFRTRCVPSIAIKSGSFILDDIYEPLQLVRVGNGEELTIEGYPAELFRGNRCVAIIDSAGMGKSTLTKYVIRRCLSELKKIPLLIELRRLKHGQTIISLICEEVLGKERSDGATSDLVLSLMEGNFLFLLDGYDEVDPELRADVSAEISRISSDYQYCNFWLTSRPDPALASFSEFSAFEISNLTYEQACSLLKRYDQGRGLASVLIEKLDSLPQVEDFLGNPLLVTLLYKAFDYKATIPIKRNIFFRQVFDALYQDHDLSKEGAFERRKKSALDLDDFHKFVRALGFVTFKGGRVQYSQIEFTGYIKEAIDKSRLPIDSAKMKSDLLSAVPIFVRDGDEVRWSHKAFQDYFAAQFIYYDSESVRDQIIDRLFASESIGRYENILSMLGELDLGLLRERCIMPFLNEVGAFDCGGEGNYSPTLRYIDSVTDIYAIKDLHPKKKAGGPSIFDHAVEELYSEFPELKGRMQIRATFSSKEYVAVVSFAKAPAIKHQIVGDMDSASFPIGRKGRIPLVVIKSFMDSRAASLSKIVRKSDDPEAARTILEAMASMAQVAAPTADSLEQLRIEVARRGSIKAAESLLDGL
ncbi:MULTISPECIES: NACHT domain-containing protein [Pseudoxanthomonas]|uniref:NACHT domain-containing protein n=1 Tax=Pseudoxanthomonas sp. SORGH_AS_0997 TaxID=3041776 RepID=UPI00278E8D24|nr:MULTISPECIES: NACHT domain-containing protein [Pseudoxanthomonas]MDQ1134889.1 hypothetical protein [Pseudoxanthomonas winnipegensis]MDR6138878.1 hypothetical protein [Pseudoxanthomonas sp. SORGH_AS_0997]